MFEFHGWTVLAWLGESTGTAAQMGALAQAIEATRSEFTSTEFLTTGNDLSVITFHGRRNHPVANILRLFEIVAKEAPASYGLLYIRDDEDARGVEFGNSFRVWRLARGEIIESADSLLSPCIPTIESSFDSACDV